MNLKEIDGTPASKIKDLIKTVWRKISDKKKKGDISGRTGKPGKTTTSDRKKSKQLELPLSMSPHQLSLGLGDKSFKRLPALEPTQPSATPIPKPKRKKREPTNAAIQGLEADFETRRKAREKESDLEKRFADPNNQDKDIKVIRMWLDKYSDENGNYKGKDLTAGGFDIAPGEKLPLLARQLKSTVWWWRQAKKRQKDIDDMKRQGLLEKKC